MTEPETIRGGSQKVVVMTAVTRQEKKVIHQESSKARANKNRNQVSFLSEQDKKTHKIEILQHLWEMKL